MQKQSTSTDDKICAETSSKFRLVLLGEKKMLRMPLSKLQAVLQNNSFKLDFVNGFF